MDIIMPVGTLNVELLESKEGRTSTCKYCGDAIRFVMTPRKKTMPVSQNEAGQWAAHFTLCRKAHLSKKNGDNSSAR